MRCGGTAVAVDVGAVTVARGSSTTKVLPTPAALDTEIVPPICWVSPRAMARPSPVPPKRRVVDASAWVNGWNRRACCASVMPIPVSATCTRRPSAVPSTVMVTDPRSVNFTALAARLVIT